MRALVAVVGIDEGLGLLEGAEGEGGDRGEGDKEHEHRERYCEPEEHCVDEAIVAAAQPHRPHLADSGLLEDQHAHKANGRRAGDGDERPDHQEENLVVEASEAIAAWVNVPCVDFDGDGEEVEHLGDLRGHRHLVHRRDQRRHLVKGPRDPAARKGSARDEHSVPAMSRACAR